MNGCKTLVVGAPVADRILVAARIAGEVADGQDISLFLLDPKAAGVRLEACRLLDGTPAGDLVLENAVVTASALLGGEGTAYVGLQRAVDEAIVSLCAETVGGMENVLMLCSEYLKTRKQFGVAIGSFTSAIRH